MSLRDVVGQDSALRMLLGARARGRVPAAYLFAGEQGIGKRFTALNFAKALNCQNPVDRGFPDACEECPSCLKVNAGTHPDVTVIELEPGSDQIKVEQIRKLEEALAFKPYEAGTKVAVVDDAEAMNINAANAFLKTLEEPSPESLIILVSSSPDRLPETVRSRCSRVNFAPLGPADCEKVMRRFRQGKDIPVLVRLSMGRPGLAAREDLLGERDRCMEALSGAGGKNPWKDRKDMQWWLELMMLLLRDLAVLKVTGQAGGLINLDIAEKLKRLSERTALDGIIECYGKLMVVKQRLGFNLNKAVTWNYALSVIEGFRGSA